MVYPRLVLLRCLPPPLDDLYLLTPSSTVLVQGPGNLSEGVSVSDLLQSDSPLGSEFS